MIEFKSITSVYDSYSYYHDHTLIDFWCKYPCSMTKNFTNRANEPLNGNILSLLFFC